MKKLWGISRKIHPEGLQRQSFTSCEGKSTQALGQKLLGKSLIFAMERECKSIANWFYFDSQRINETDLSPDINLVFLFPFFWVQNSSYPKELASGGPKKWFKCSSYPRFELTSDFYKKVFGNLLGTARNSFR